MHELQSLQRSISRMRLNPLPVNSGEQANVFELNESWQVSRVYAVHTRGKERRRRQFMYAVRCGDKRYKLVISFKVKPLARLHGNCLQRTHAKSTTRAKHKNIIDSCLALLFAPIQVECIERMVPSAHAMWSRLNARAHTGCHPYRCFHSIGPIFRDFKCMWIESRMRWQRAASAKDHVLINWCGAREFHLIFIARYVTQSASNTNLIILLASSRSIRIPLSVAFASGLCQRATLNARSFNDFYATINHAIIFVCGRNCIVIERRIRERLFRVQKPEELNLVQQARRHKRLGSRTRPKRKNWARSHIHTHTFDRF